MDADPSRTVEMSADAHQSITLSQLSYLAHAETQPPHIVVSVVTVSVLFTKEFQDLRTLAMRFPNARIGFAPKSRHVRNILLYLKHPKNFCARVFSSGLCTVYLTDPDIVNDAVKHMVRTFHLSGLRDLEVHTIESIHWNGCGDFSYEVNLEALEKEHSSFVYFPEMRKDFLVFKVFSPNHTCQIYASGKFQIRGMRCRQEANLALKIMSAIVEKFPLHHVT